ncbi:MAG: hypothetical protein K1Y36_14625 [Blastocatellia bacterium]|nr:hypothetical protein [Blastocatellia bacterium]
MARPARFKLVLVGVFLALAVVTLIFTRSQVQAMRELKPELAQVEYAGSASCQECHKAEFDHWSESHHHKMNQIATPETVVGDFNNATYTFNGVTSRMYRKGNDFYIYTMDLNGKMGEALIVRTVGSRRFQQYITLVGTTFYRLPIAWNIEKKYWFHLQGLFLHPDREDFKEHLSTWNNNCIFCHNVKGKPGMEFPSRKFVNTKVAELGIGCEACHGPGKLHVEKNKTLGWSWLRRQIRADDPTIVEPKKLDKTTQLQICGHCHGQRIPVEGLDIKTVMEKGDPYTAGENLSKYFQPLNINTKVGDYSFAPRFYPDGTPRLTAYEYQGVLQSKCYQQGDMTCNSCHDVHRGRQQSLLTDNMRGNDGCVQCHQQIAANLAAHTHHKAESNGSSCNECHRPRIVFGLLTAKRSHRVHNPDAAKSLATNMPNGCNMCHQKETAVWAAQTISQWYGKPVPFLAPGGDSSEMVRELFSGDPSARCVAAWSLGQPGATSRREENLWAIPFLIQALRDPYPAVRYFAYDSLRAVAQKDIPFNYLDAVTNREAVINQYQAWWQSLPKPDTRFKPATVPLGTDWNIPAGQVTAYAETVRKSTAIEIGE